MRTGPRIEDLRVILLVFVLNIAALSLIALHSPRIIQAPVSIAGVLAAVYLVNDMRLIDAGKDTLASRLTRKNDTDTDTDTPGGTT